MSDKSALATPYESAPGHGPSLSAYCHANGIVFGSHPWNHHQANFQIIHEGHILVNVTTGPEQHWTFPLGDYTIKYAGKSYEVRQDQCDTQSTTTTTPSTTTTSEAPTTTTSTTVLPTTTTLLETTTTAQETTTTASLQEVTAPPSQSTTTESPATTAPVVITTWSTTPAESTVLLEASSPLTTVPNSNGNLPHTGADTSGLLFAGVALCMIGAGLKRRFGKVKA